MAKPFSPALVGSGLVIAALLAGSAYYTYRTQTIRLTKVTPVIINTSTPKEVVPEQIVTCTPLDASFKPGETSQNFPTKKLVPVQVRVASFIYPEQNQVLVLNPGQPTLMTIKSEANWYNVIKPVTTVTTTLVDDAQAVRVGPDLFLFSIEEWGFGSGLVANSLYKVTDHTLRAVPIPAKYSPTEEFSCSDDPDILECPGGDGNPISATALVGATEAAIVFKTGYNTSTYAAFNVTSSRWVDLKANDPTLKDLRPSRKSLAEALKNHQCLSQETEFGTLLYRKNSLTEAKDDWSNGLNEYGNIAIYWLAK